MSYINQKDEMSNQAEKHKHLVWTSIKITFVVFAVCLVLLIVTLIVSLFSGAKDTEAPTIIGPADGMVVGYVGEVPMYKKMVRVEDNIDSAPRLQIDNSQVNKDAVGEYEVYYRAIDEAGNRSEVYTLKYVVMSLDYPEDELMKLIAAEAEAYGITKDMSKKAQVRKIYTYVQSKIKWNDEDNDLGESNIPDIDRSKWKTDWIEEATRTLDTGKGDCYSYYSLSKAFFEYFGIANEGIKRSESSTQEGTHFWQVVQIEEGWYYYDGTRLGGHFGNDRSDKNACLITQAKLDSYKTSYPDDIDDFYKMDRPVSKVSKTELTD